MSNKPVWALGQMLRSAGVPCSEEIAMMLVKKTSVPDTPYAAEDLKTIGGSYISAVGFQVSSDEKYEQTTSFYVGEFPLEQKFEYQHNSNDNGEGTKEAYLDLTVTDFGWTPEVGDFIKLRYMLPEITRCKFSNIYSTVQGSMYKNPDYYTYEVTVRSSGEDTDKPSCCTVTYSTEDGTAACYDYSQDKPQYYAELLKNRSFTPVMDGDSFVGFELTGWLMQPITTLRILITGVKDYAYNYAWINLSYPAYDNLTLEAYDIPVPKDPTSGTLVGWNYGGIVLPKLPDEVMAQPYVFVGHTETTDVAYGFSGTPSAWSGSVSVLKYLGTEEAGSKVRATLTDGAWSIVENVESDATVSYTFGNVVWANFDVYDTDGNLHIAASEPVPVYE